MIRCSIGKKMDTNEKKIAKNLLKQNLTCRLPENTEPSILIVRTNVYVQQIPWYDSKGVVPKTMNNITNITEHPGT
jgi:hypothetical protein